MACLVRIYKELLVIISSILGPSFWRKGVVSVPVFIILESTVAVFLRFSLNLNVNFLWAFWLLREALDWTTAFDSLLRLPAVSLDSFQFIYQNSLLLHVCLVDLRVLLVLHFSQHGITHSITLLLVLGSSAPRVESQRLRHTQIARLSLGVLWSATLNVHTSLDFSCLGDSRNIHPTWCGSHLLWQQGLTTGSIVLIDLGQRLCRQSGIVVDPIQPNSSHIVLVVVLQQLVRHLMRALVGYRILEIFIQASWILVCKKTYLFRSLKLRLRVTKRSILLH